MRCGGVRARRRGSSGGVQARRRGSGDGAGTAGSERWAAVGSPDSTVFVRADAALPYGEVMELMRMLHAANITRMALVTEADSL